MISLAAACLLVFLGVEGSSIQDLLKISEKVEAAKSYRVEISVEQSGGPASIQKKTAVSCKVERGKPFLFTKGNHTIYRNRSQTVYKNKEGVWTLVDLKKAQAGARARGGKSSPALQAAMSIAALPVPHHALQDLKKKIEKVEKTEKDGMTIHYANLTADGAKELSGGRSGKPGSQQPEYSGRIGVVVNAKGGVERLEVHTLTRIQRGDKAIERKKTIMMKVRDLNTTKVEVPKQVVELMKG